MEYKEIVAVTGLGGLYQLLSSKSDGAIVRSLEDQSTRFASSRQHNFTPLESIEVFTTGENVPLSHVLKAMQDGEAAHPPVPARSDNQAIKSYFKAVFPELDEERVYMSDMKKMLKWYEILKATDLLHFEEEEAAAEEEQAAEEVVAEEPAPAAKKEKTEKTAAKKAAAKKAETEKTEAAGAEKPAAKKKSPAKKENPGT